MTDQLTPETARTVKLQLAQMNYFDRGTTGASYEVFFSRLRGALTVAADELLSERTEHELASALLMKGDKQIRFHLFADGGQVVSLEAEGDIEHLEEVATEGALRVIGEE